MNDLEKQLLDTLYEKYQTMTLGKKEASEILGRSRASLDNDRVQGVGVPYIQHSAGATVKYPLHEIVKHLVHDTVKTA
ncbi:hypothetical protein SAMN06313540_1127 [Epsilonproteobacteria bacterium SCGC AD-308-E02]|nr:hypothetical protein SAMN06313540_1127 [Epsilonproteobacteria bacterium SCGC AD-308-E02]